ncbi:L-alanine dehydrogenase [Alteribacillus persepolensis]|uniref:Alanine dehydrogenase n=1 Tax=Alteribacillus persepolensis TaxID=568899 RepID=A0A1G8JL88_9BACI|nr:alanine dehydrogenase [Alteribacillus persepolensis]SDI32079.1 L-alanine dehydrogenase [Alteribacillus persepolensis]
MKIGIPREIKNNENRVAISPSGVDALVKAGHEVVIESQAGIGSGFFNEEYEKSGARIEKNVEKVWLQEMVIKVKEPQPEEYQHFRENLILFTYLHLAAEPSLTEALMDSKVVSIAYETIQEKDDSLPLLAPMSEVAGRIASQIGAQFLEKPKGGKGILLSGVPGVHRGKVTVIGGGVVGTNAAKIAIGLGADVTILDLNPTRLRELDSLFGNQVKTIMSNPLNIAESVAEADLVIGAVLIPGTKAPKLVSEDMVKAMKHKSVIVDVAIDQGGIFETSGKITTHDNPTYEKHGVVHYAVANMPGAVPRTSSIGLTNVTLPYAMKIANKGYIKASLEDEAISKGINTMKGFVTYEAVAEAHGLEYKNPNVLLNDSQMATQS